MRLPEPGLPLTLRLANLLRWAIVGGWITAWVGVVSGLWRARGEWIALFVISLFTVLLVSGWIRWRREHFIREAPLPQFLKRKLRETYPHLTQKDCDMVERGLRQFFLACLRSNRRFVSMPSQVVDVMWHEFILHTRGYNEWCHLALGRFLHHTPAEVLGTNPTRNDGLRRAWFWSCRDESIDPRAPTRLPLLFALDVKLAIPNGYHYAPDCKGFASKEGGNSTVHCGGSFSDGSHSGDGDAFGGSDSSGSDGDGGGCGGD